MRRIYCSLFSKICAQSRKATCRLGDGLCLLSPWRWCEHLRWSCVWRREKSSDLKFGGGLNCCLKMFFPPPGDLKPAGLATRKLDELLLSDSHMAGGMEVTVVPSLPSQISAIQSTHPVLTEDCSWFFLSKYLQYGQSLLLKSFRLPLSHVAAWRPDRGTFFSCLTSTPLTRLVPRGIAASLAAASLLECDVQISGRWWRGVPFHWAVRCGSLISSAVV